MKLKALSLSYYAKFKANSLLELFILIQKSHYTDLGVGDPTILSSGPCAKEKIELPNVPPSPKYKHCIFMP